MSVRKGLVLFSGGLDSLVVALLLKRYGVPFEGVYFDVPYFGSADRVRRLAMIHDIPLNVIDFWDDMQNIIRKPRWGYGRALNPCADCHFEMIKKALKMRHLFGAEYVVTGEVLGERPMSQRREILDDHLNYLGDDADLLLRPMSARLLPPSKPVREGWVPDEILLDFKGRNRTHIIELAEKLGAKEIPTPAGGCLLTEHVYARRLCLLLGLLDYVPRDFVYMLKIGRHLIKDGGKHWLVIARNKDESTELKAVYNRQGISLEGVQTGPFAVYYTFDADPLPYDEMASYVAYYSSKIRKMGAADYRYGDGQLVHVVPKNPEEHGWIHLSEKKVMCPLKGRLL
ncbi:tRNA 4-thiouridine(8) synthase ThiI [bacterium 3DAC]|nr:tRNA 4-thiouridine(8) synthase ThiI [bacterium 3DAC]